MDSTESRAIDPDIAKVVGDLASLIQRKRDQYGTANLEVFGEFGILVRSFDKVYRLRNLLDTGKVPEDESVADSWADLAGYAILALIMRQAPCDE